MPCRPKLCQRLAAQLTQSPSTTHSNGSHIWVSDDLLSEAFNRYVQVSHANRRYGSHVPGPLEHRRRLAKRRMGCTAIGVGAPIPPGGDFGALFGAREHVGTGWKWEAPGLKLGEPPPRGNERKVVEEWDWGIGPQHLAAPFDPVEVSRQDFHELIEARKDLKIVDEHALHPVLEFLCSTRDEPAATNLWPFMVWLSGRPTTVPALDALIEFFCERLETQALSWKQRRKLFGMIPHMVERSRCEDPKQREYTIYTQFWHALQQNPEYSSMRLFSLLEMMLKASPDPQSLETTIGLLGPYMASLERCFTTDLAKCLLEAMKSLHSMEMPDADKERMLERLKDGLDQMPAAVDFDRPSIFLECTSSKSFRNYFPDELHAEIVPRLLEVLRVCDHLEPGHVKAEEIYALLAKYMKPVDLAGHWKRMDAYGFCHILLHSWLPNTDLEALVQDTRHEVEPILDTVGMKHLTFSRMELSHDNLPLVQQHFANFWDEEQDIYSSDVARFLDSEDNIYRSDYPDHPDHFGPRDLVRYYPALEGTPQVHLLRPQVHLIRAFAAAGVRYDRIVQVLFKTWQAVLQPKPLHNTFCHAYRHEELAMPTPAAIDLINYLLTVSLPLRALMTFRMVPSVCITDVPNLLLELLKKDITPSHIIFEFLNRQPHHIRLEDRAVERLNIPAAQIDYAHIIARVLSQHPSLRSRVAYRRVWSIYRWLNDHGAPLQPLLTRALVHSGIIRPLQDRRLIAKARVKFIVDLVARVEGQAVANDVDRLTYLLQSKTYPEASRRKRLQRWAELRRPKETAWAKKVRYRVRLWTKVRPMRVLHPDGEMGYVVPGQEKRDEDGELVPYLPLDELPPIKKHVVENGSYASWEALEGSFQDASASGEEQLDVGGGEEGREVLRDALLAQDHASLEMEQELTSEEAKESIDCSTDAMAQQAELPAGVEEDSAPMQDQSRDENSAWDDLARAAAMEEDSDRRRNAGVGRQRAKKGKKEMKRRGREEPGECRWT